MTPTDRELIESFKNGDGSSLEYLIQRHTPSVYNLARRLVGRDDADDMTQNVFIKAWKNLEKFDESKSSFKTWLLTITRNTITDFLRKKKSIVFSNKEDGEDSFGETLADDSPLPSETLERLMDAQYLNTLLAQLPVEYQAVLTLYYQEEMTFKEIGLILGKPVNTVKSQHLRAVKKLKSMAKHIE